MEETRRISRPEGMNANPAISPPTRLYELAITVRTYIVVRFKVVSLRSETRLLLASTITAVD